MIRAPFNFVPLANKVYIPHWGSQISQDIPFSDGLSGYIDLSITALSPIFIRNGHTKEEAEQGKAAIKTAIKINRDNPDFTQAKRLDYNSFCKCPEGYFIPATSIKGEVRSILEIMTFSKMRVDKNVKFAQREWDNDNLYPKQEIQKDLLCGYLKWNSKKGIYEITSCGKPYRIGLDKIDEYLSSTYKRKDVFKRFFSLDHDAEFDINNTYVDGKQEFDPKTASFKYHLIGNARISNLFFDKDESSTKYSTRLKVSEEGDIEGDIVFTGQPGYCKWDRHKKKKDAGKFYEFVFPAPSENNKDSISMSEIEFNYFKFIYSESKEWPRVQELLEKDEKGVPVFFRKEKKRNKEGKDIVSIKDFGLAYMYKLPYDYSPNDILEKKYKQYDGQKDLVECLFGMIGSNKENEQSLKGRVLFSNCISHSAEEHEPITLVLNSPKASYYPIYIKQEGEGGIISINYHTYNDGELSGWKRYVVRNSKNDGIWKNSVGNPDIDSTLFPLKAGAIFNGKVIFHNLRPVELGALLSALTFHSTEGCCHLLGQGKPYGFGKTKYDVSLHCRERIESKEYFMALFERTITKQVTDWRNTDTIRSLIALSRKEVEANEGNYKYMTLDVKDSINDFVDAKKERKYLQNFISLNGGRNYSPNLIEQQKTIVEEKANGILKDIKEQYEQTINVCNGKIDAGEYREALLLLQETIKSISNPPEPVDTVEVKDLVVELNKKMEEIKIRINEIEYANDEAKYRDELASSSISDIRVAIEQLSLKDYPETERWINDLNKRIEQIKKGNSPISVFLLEVKTTSVAAFANGLKKRTDPIKKEDIPFIVNRLNSGIAELKKNDKKNWYERKKWKPIQDVIGEELTNAIFSQIQKE